MIHENFAWICGKGAERVASCRHGETLPLRQVEIAGGFWRDKTELIRREVIPYQWRAINDRVEGAEPSWCMRNFRIAGRILRGETERAVKPENEFRPLPADPGRPEATFYGFAFQDSDLFKWLEAAAYSLTQYPDPELERLADGAVDLICAAQREDGYLDTYFTIRDPEGVFTDLRDRHELYCFGHLTEAAVAYWQATGKDRLLNAARRYAGYIAGRIGPGPGQLHGYPGHEIAEMALARLYEATGERAWLELAKFFIDERGRRPYYYDREHPEGAGDPAAERYQYQQAHRPVREQDEAVGHAVRAMYLYSGMADVARLTEDEGLFEACRRLWSDVTGRKMYITGGVGGTVHGEAFSHAYDLPADTAYAETCAAVGLVFWARRMLQYRPDSRYADVMERALYNGVLSGMALDGKSFFYTNPLECVPEDCRRDQRKAHIRLVRQKWFGCACCPPNLARLIGSVGQYAFTRAGDRLYLHLLMDAAVTVDGVRVEVSCGMPWDGAGTIRIRGLERGRRLELALRLPEWTDHFSVDGGTYQDMEDWIARGRAAEEGYLLLELEADRDVPFAFSMPVRFLRANRRVREAAGQLAVARGPIVYCLEEADNGPELHLLRLDPTGPTETERAEICGERIVAVTTAGVREADEPEGALYARHRPEEPTPVRLRWIPYYTWANRGENEMRVWCRSL